jgi:hypothetical protein
MGYSALAVIGAEQRNNWQILIGTWTGRRLPVLIDVHAHEYMLLCVVGGLSMTQSANKDCVQRHFEELWNHGEIEKIDEFFSQEFTNFDVRYSDVRGIIQHMAPGLS